MQVVMKNFFSTEVKAFEVDLECQAIDNDSRTTLLPKGIYCQLDGHVVGLFVARENLFLYLDGHACEIRENEEMVFLHRDGQNHQLKLFVEGKATTVVYMPQSPVTTPFYSEDEEDADFGFWLVNILNSEERRKTILQNWKTI